jgi:cbb3-type cytochrome c oxidase subunit III
MDADDRPKLLGHLRRRWCAIACATAILAAAIPRPASADCGCGKTWPHLICRTHVFGHMPGPGDIINADTGGSWYWMRSPEQERRVVMGIFNRYCIRCHGVDGRGVWDIPDVPDFTNAVWQNTRPDEYRARVILEGRGAVMPTFRGTLTLEEAAAMARYLHTFAPGNEVSRPGLGPAAAAPAAPSAPATAPAVIPPPVSRIPAATSPAPASASPSPFGR